MAEIKVRTGIMGGTFNPIHNGHLMLADAAYKELCLDKVIFVPSGNPYMKTNVLEVSKRVDMVRLAIDGQPQFELSMIEAKSHKNSYTSETLERLAEENPDICRFLIIGADSLFQMEKWHKPEKIFSLATLVCAVRDDCGIDEIKRKGEELSRMGAEIIYLDMPKIDISSTDIREKVRKKLSIDEFVPAKVADYIKQERLYYEED